MWIFPLLVIVLLNQKAYGNTPEKTEAELSELPSDEKSAPKLFNLLSPKITTFTEFSVISSSVFEFCFRTLDATRCARKKRRRRVLPLESDKNRKVIDGSMQDANDEDTEAAAKKQKFGVFQVWETTKVTETITSFIFNQSTQVTLTFVCTLNNFKLPRLC